MSGNAWEWTADRYDDKLQGGNDPRGVSRGADRVIRSGSWSFTAPFCRSAYRNGDSPGYRSYDLGFRVARGPSEQAGK